MKTWKNLIIPVIILVVLIAGLLIYKNISDKEAAASASDSAATTTLSADIMNYTSDQISEIQVVGSDNSGFSIRQDGLNADNSIKWAYSSLKEDVSAYSFSQANMLSFINIIGAIPVADNVGQGVDLSEYGLDKPAYTVTYKMANGDTHVLTFGDVTKDDSSVYCRLDGAGDVYTTSKIKLTKCQNTILDFLDLTITAITNTDVASISFKRTSDNLDALIAGAQVLSNDGSQSEFGWVFNKPFTIEASPEFDTLMTSVFALSVTSYVDLNPSDYSKYGLDAPAYEFGITLNSGKLIKISLSRDMGGIYYGISSASPAVFTLSKDVVTGLETPLVELIIPYLSYNFISNVKAIDATFPEGSFETQMDVGPNVKISDDTSKVSLDGRDAKVFSSDNRSYFAVLFESLVCIDISDFDLDAKPADTKDITIVITKKDSTQITIDLAVKDENTYYAFIDGEYQGFLVNRDSLYKDNGTTLFDYGIWTAYTLLNKAIDGASNGVYTIPAS